MRRLYREAWIFSATQSKEDEEATVTQLTMVRGRYHGPIVVLVETDFLLLSCTTGIALHRGLWRGQNTSNEGQILGKKA